MQVRRIHMHMEVLPSSLPFKQYLPNIYKWFCITNFYWKSNIMHYITMALHSYIQDNSNLQHSCFCAFAFRVGTSASLPLIWQCWYSHPHWGVSVPCCHSGKKVRTAATELEILFLKSCLMHVSPLQHANLWGTSLLTHISTSADLVSISRQFCLM